MAPLTQKKNAKCMQMQTRKQGGFALVEALVALSVLLLVATVFVVLVNQGYTQVFFASHFTQSLFEAQGQIDAALGSEDSNGDEVELEIQFPGVGVMDVSGEVLSVPVEFGGRHTLITVFDPRR